MTRHRDESVSFTEVFELPTRVNLRTAAEALGLSPATAYRRARQGEFPCRLRKEGRVYVVRLVDLMRGLGIQDVRVHDDDIEAGARFASGNDEEQAPARDSRRRRRGR
ncbi:helix-turn-helix transcriptional regulator [Streptomyces sp. PTD5-9]|uniref:helix-turn-helix transcriptional regulator n=1 Tax=Streptomyces sp. PTD5-9 TaxID=3120150 RepID=UPI0030097772